MNITTINSSLAGNYTSAKPNIVSQFLNWCEAQEHNRFMWLGLALSIFGCVLTPVAMFIISLTGMDIALVGVTAFSMAFVLITNLAAMPTRITIPTFFISLLIDIVVIALALA